VSFQKCNTTKIKIICRIRSSIAIIVIDKIQLQYVSSHFSHKKISSPVVLNSKNSNLKMSWRANKKVDNQRFHRHKPCACCSKRAPHTHLIVGPIVVDDCSESPYLCSYHRTENNKILQQVTQPFWKNHKILLTISYFYYSNMFITYKCNYTDWEQLGHSSLTSLWTVQASWISIFCMNPGSENLFWLRNKKIKGPLTKSQGPQGSSRVL